MHIYMQIASTQLLSIYNTVEAHCHVVELEMGQISEQLMWHKSQWQLLNSMPHELLTNSPHFKLLI